MSSVSGPQSWYKTMSLLHVYRYDATASDNMIMILNVTLVVAWFMEKGYARIKLLSRKKNKSMHAYCWLLTAALAHGITICVLWTRDDVTMADECKLAPPSPNTRVKRCFPIETPTRKIIFKLTQINLNQLGLNSCDSTIPHFVVVYVRIIMRGRGSHGDCDAMWSAFFRELCAYNARFLFTMTSRLLTYPILLAEKGIIQTKHGSIVVKCLITHFLRFDTSAETKGSSFYRRSSQINFLDSKSFYLNPNFIDMNSEWSNKQ